MKRQIAGSTIIAAMLLGSGAPAAAKPPSDVSDLVGARAAGAETAMESRGYEMTRTSGGAQYWWNSGTKTCVSVTVSNGRYASVNKADSSNCGHGGGGGDAAAAVGAIAAVGLIAALASHKKKHGDHGDSNHDGDYNRGYNDGLYGGQYDRHDSEAYHDGFMAGETEASNRRMANRSYARGGPDAARTACERRADQYQNAPWGSSVAVSQRSAGGGNYVFTMATGHYRSTCTASSNGQVIDISPY
ncbi:hypothetical protein [Sphingopyxis sp.]|uniref:hypothetical protein n=1 Tax=Sphingopyxis sp. TaxID=1908224 RepID=UPI003F6EEE55